jgi:LysM repeat protein
MGIPMTVNDTIESYRKRRGRLTPLILGGLAILLVIVGVIIVVISMRGGGLAQLLATKTPTPTITPLPTDTPTLTNTPTITPTPTITLTATPSGPYSYVVQEGDTLTSIIEAQGLGDTPYAILLIYVLNPYNPDNAENPGIDPDTANIFVGQTITLPNAGMEFPTSTPIPTGLTPGSRISYYVLPGDSVGAIAIKFNSTIDAIVAANKVLFPDAQKLDIFPGWTLVVPIDLVTPVPTKAATPTPTPTATP